MGTIPQPTFRAVGDLDKALRSLSRVADQSSAGEDVSLATITFNSSLLLSSSNQSSWNLEEDLDLTDSSWVGRRFTIWTLAFQGFLSDDLDKLKHSSAERLLYMGRKLSVRNGLYCLCLSAGRGAALNL